MRTGPLRCTYYGEVVYVINHMLKDYFLFLKILNNGIRGYLWLPVGLSTFGQRILRASEMKILENPG